MELIGNWKAIVECIEMFEQPCATVLLIGETAASNCSSVVSYLQSACRLFTAADISTACRLLEAADALPDLALIVKSRPGEHSLGDVDRLRRAAPMTRLVALLGSWCEGESRSGAPWPGVPRLYWHQAQARLQQELPRLAARRSTGWGLPLTATEEERLLLTVSNAQTPGEPQMRSERLVALDCESRDLSALLADALQQRGYRVRLMGADALASPGDIHLALCESSLLDTKRIDHLARLAAAVRPAPMLALLGFPRPHEMAAVIQAGAAAVISKPLLLCDLFAEMARLR